jgi:hypothetical protein
MKFLARIAAGIIGTLAIASITPSIATGENPQKSEPTPTTAQPSRLSITVQVTEPDDLKVSEGDAVEVGQILADRDRERTSLELQRDQLMLTIAQLENAPITPPLPPAPVPATADLPPAAVESFHIQIEQSAAAIEQLDKRIEEQRNRIQELGEYDEPAITAHESAKLTRMDEDRADAVRAYELAIANLDKAEADRQHVEYLDSLTIAERVEQANDTALQFQRQLQEFESQTRDRMYQLSQTRMRLDDVSSKLDQLATVRSPYAGTVRRVKWIGQQPDGTITAELSLRITDADRMRDRE